MDINRLIGSVKAHPAYSDMGMIAGHLGIVRRTSLNGREVTAMDVRFRPDRISAIIRETKELPGVLEVLIETREGRLEVGEEIMAVVVGGDTREHVFFALSAAVDRIKSEGATKKEFFVDEHD